MQAMRRASEAIQPYTDKITQPLKKISPSEKMKETIAKVAEGATEGVIMGSFAGIGSNYFLGENTSGYFSNTLSIRRFIGESLTLPIVSASAIAGSLHGVARSLVKDPKTRYGAATMTILGAALFFKADFSETLLANGIYFVLYKSWKWIRMHANPSPAPIATAPTVPETSDKKVN
jgi:hypothetical protein